MEQIKNAISNVSDRIKGYTEAAEGFVTDVGKETNRLEILIKRLRECLEKFKKLKTDYDLLIQKITSLEAKIVSLKTITSEAASSAGTEACNEKLTEILGLITAFGENIKDFNGDVGGLKGQVSALETLIGEICDEADELVKQQENVEEARKKLEKNLGGDGQVDEPVQEQVEEGLPDGWKKFIDDATGKPYYQGPDGEVTWEKPTSPSMGALASAAVFGSKLKDKADVELAQFAYKDPKDPARLDMQKDMRNAQNPFDVKVDDSKYVAKSGRSKKWNVSWIQGPDRPMYSLAEGGTFNDGDGDKEETDKHPSEFENSMQGGKRKRKTRKKRGGWQTPEKLSSLSKTKPIRTLGYLKKKTKKRKNKKKKKKKTRGRNRRKKNKKRTKRR
jgi:hypothetical protein